MGKGTFAIIVNQTESKAKTPSTDNGFLFPGFPASKLRAEKMVLSSDGQELSNGKGKVIKNTYWAMGMGNDGIEHKISFHNVGSSYRKERTWHKKKLHVRGSFEAYHLSFSL